jgi:hypothetical protein
MENQWVEARSCNWLHEAEFLKSVLEAADIEAWIPDEYALGVQPAIAGPVGGVRLLVRSHDLDRAHAVLDEASSSNRRPHGDS